MHISHKKLLAICIDFVGCVTRLCFFSSSSYGSAIWTSVSLFLINFNLINSSKGFATYTHSLLYVSWYICITVKHGYKNNEFMVTAKFVYSHNCKSFNKLIVPNTLLQWWLTPIEFRVNGATIMYDHCISRNWC